MNQDLRSRIPVAILYVLIIAGATLWGPTPTVLLMIVFFGLCLLEFNQPKKPFSTLEIIALFILPAILIALPLSQKIIPFNPLILALLSCIFIIINMMHLMIKKKNIFDILPHAINTLIYVALPFALSILLIDTVDGFTHILLGTFIILWLNDAGAYFTGKAFGKNKLFYSISPGKTWEGLIGGGIIGMIAAPILYQLLNQIEWRSWIFLSIIIWIAGSFGDLTESAWKRNAGIKDSGTLMRGHGGFLDRLDSFLYAIPFVSLFIIFSK